MSIEATSSVGLAAVAQAGPALPTAAAAVDTPPAKAAPLQLNPRIEFDPSLRVVVFEFVNPQTHDVRRYPDTTNAAVRDRLGRDSSV